jgi:isopentenyl-diphosphate delta-isomerase type 1
MNAKEFLDIVNMDDIVIGREARSVIHQRGDWHRGVHVFLFAPDGRMLVQKRSADRASAPSALDCSVSEHVQSGESYYDAAIRGMKEEMGVEGIPLTRLAKFRMNYGINDNEVSELYEGVVDPASVNFDPVEIESIHYYSMDELRAMMRESKVKLCGWFLELLELYLNGRGKMEQMDSGK